MVTYRKSLTEHDTKVNQYNAQLKQNEKTVFGLSLTSKLLKSTWMDLF